MKVRKKKKKESKKKKKRKEERKKMMSGHFHWEIWIDVQRNLHLPQTEMYV